MGSSYAEVVEGIRATIARYTHALDDGRTDDVVATFCDDATVEIPGQGTFVGLDAIREAYAGWTPVAPQRHLVVNTLVSDWSDSSAAATSDVVFLFKAEKGWRVQFVARYEDRLCCDDGTWRFHERRVDEA